MLVLLLLVLNWFILLAATNFTYQCFLGPSNLFYCGVFSFILIVSLTFLFNASSGPWLLQLISGSRRVIHREHEKLSPLIKQVQQVLYEKFGLNPITIQLMIIDDPVLNALAISKTTLVVTRGLYETANEEELVGILAHEMRHLHYADSQRLGIALGVSIISLLIAFISGIIVRFIDSFSQDEGIKIDNKELRAVLKIFLLIFKLFFYFFLLFVCLGNWVLKLAVLFQARKQEYKADQFAIQAGFGAGLLSFLEKVKNFEFQGKRTFMSRLSASHPPVMLRIEEIERMMVQERE